jgi:hypothetical protein
VVEGEKSDPVLCGGEVVERLYLGDVGYYVIVGYADAFWEAGCSVWRLRKNLAQSGRALEANKMR